MDFETRIAGIPCWIDVTYATPVVPAKLSGHPDNWCPAEGGDFEFRVYTKKAGAKKAYLAPWLERKLTSADEDRIYEEYSEHCEKNYDPT